MMKIIRNLFLTVTLIQLNHVFAAPASYGPHGTGQGGDRNFNSRPIMPAVHTDILDSTVTSGLFGIPFEFYLKNEIKRWNEHLKVFVSRRIPDTSETNKRLREYLLDLESWAPRHLKSNFYYKCEYYLKFFRWAYISVGGVAEQFDVNRYSPRAAYDALRHAMDEMYVTMIDKFRSVNQVNSVTTMEKFKENKFIVYRTIHEKEKQLFSLYPNDDPASNDGKAVHYAFVQLDKQFSSQMLESLDFINFPVNDW